MARGACLCVATNTRAKGARAGGLKGLGGRVAPQNTDIKRLIRAQLSPWSRPRPPPASVVKISQQLRTMLPCHMYIYIYIWHEAF